MLTWSFYLERILPVGFFMALTLLFGNIVYLYLTVSFIQMLKVSVILLCSWPLLMRPFNTLFLMMSMSATNTLVTSPCMLCFTIQQHEGSPTPKSTPCLGLHKRSTEACLVASSVPDAVVEVSPDPMRTGIHASHHHVGTIHCSS